MKINTMTPVFFTDSSSAVAIAKKSVSHQRIKHIEIDIHKIRDKVLTKEISLDKINTKLNVANLFTKTVT